MWPFSREPDRSPVVRIPPTFSNATLENPNTSLANPAAWLVDVLGGGPTYAGPNVSETTAMRSTAVFRSVALKAGVIASLTLKVYRRTPKGREEATNHRLAPLLESEPNDLMSSFIWKELVVTNLMLAGNHYSVIEYDNASRVVGLLPVIPQKVEVERVNGRNRYKFHLNDDSKEVIDQADVVHIPGLGFDGLKGISPIAWAGRQPVGIALAMEEFVGRMHANSARPSGWMALPQNITPEGVIRMRLEFEKMYAGAGSAGRTMLLDHGSTWNPMQMSLEDAQTLDSRRFQVADIARLFGVPPHLIGETDKTSSWGTGVEQITIGFQKFNIDPELTRIEGELNRKLFTWPFYCEFNRDALNAMDAKATSELFASALNNARMTPNEIRRRMNLPDKEGGDELYIQGATVPLSMAGKQQQQPAAPNPEPSQSEDEPDEDVQ